MLFVDNFFKGLQEFFKPKSEIIILSLDQIADKEIAATVLNWQFLEWGKEGAGVVANSIITYVAMMGDKPIGCASLVKNDLFRYHYLKPWLAGVYVHEDYRNRKIAAKLIKEVEKTAKYVGYRDLFLFTSLVGFYESKGYSTVSTIVGSNTDFIMKKEL